MIGINVFKKQTLRFSNKFRLILAIALLALTWSASASYAAQATVNWAAPTNYAGGAPIPDFVGFNLYVGTNSGSYSQKIDVGELTSYTVTGLADNTAYFFAVTAYDSLGNESAYSSEISNGAAAQQPASSLYTLSASAGSGGTITPSGSVVVSQGTAQSFAIAPASGYKVTGVTVDGASVGAVTSYTFSNVAGNHTITAAFAVNSYSIAASAGTGGSITPAGTTSVNAGGSQVYSITPASGYQIASVTVDGASVG
ncbi:InlB B-repeat-containing protein, partial [Geomesophilobacter sediminis]|nr:fibronectin type III domain-containing protein [Geomesophilobacter sediminis]